MSDQNFNNLLDRKILFITFSLNHFNLLNLNIVKQRETIKF